MLAEPASAFGIIHDHGQHTAGQRDSTAGRGKLLYSFSLQHCQRPRLRAGSLPPSHARSHTRYISLSHFTYAFHIYGDLDLNLVACTSVIPKSQGVRERSVLFHPSMIPTCLIPTKTVIMNLAVTATPLDTCTSHGMSASIWLTYCKNAKYSAESKLLQGTSQHVQRMGWSGSGGCHAHAENIASLGADFESAYTDVVVLQVRLATNATCTLSSWKGVCAYISAYKSSNGAVTSCPRS